MNVDQLVALEETAATNKTRKAKRGSLVVEMRDDVSRFGNSFHYFDGETELSRVQFAQLPLARV